MEVSDRPRPRPDLPRFAVVDRRPAGQHRRCLSRLGLRDLRDGSDRCPGADLVGRSRAGRPDPPRRSGHSRRRRARRVQRRPGARGDDVRRRRHRRFGSGPDPARRRGRGHSRRSQPRSARPSPTWPPAFGREPTWCRDWVVPGVSLPPSPASDGGSSDRGHAVRAGRAVDLDGRQGSSWGAFCSVAGGLKVIDPQSSVQAVQAYELLPEELARIVGWGLPFVEIAVGAAADPRAVHPGGRDQPPGS